MEKMCKNCVSFIVENVSSSAIKSECRYFPPIVTGFPAVTETTWCSQFQSRAITAKKRTPKKAPWNNKK